MNGLFHVHRWSQQFCLALHLYMQNVKFRITCIGCKWREQIRGFHITCKKGSNNCPLSAICQSCANTKWAVFKIPFYHCKQEHVGDCKGLTQHKTLTNGYIGKDGCNLTDFTAITKPFFGFFLSQTSKRSHSRTRKQVNRHMGLHLTAFHILWHPQLTLHTLTCSCLMDSDFSEHFLSERCRFSWHSKRLCSAALSNSG